MSEQSTCPTSISQQEILLHRIIDAPCHLVFEAWTTPSLVDKWWGPAGYQTFDCQIELRQGGLFSLKMRGPDGAVYPCCGTILEIVAPRRLVISGIRHAAHACGAGIPPRSVVTVSFDEFEGRRTTLTIHTQFENSVHCQSTLDAGYEPGWNQTLDRMSQTLAGSSAEQT